MDDNFSGRDFFKTQMDFYFEGEKEEIQQVWDGIKDHIEKLRTIYKDKLVFSMIQEVVWVLGDNNRDVIWYLNNTKRNDPCIQYHRDKRGLKRREME